MEGKREAFLFRVSSRLFLMICTVHSRNTKGHQCLHREQPLATEILSASLSMKREVRGDAKADET